MIDPERVVGALCWLSHTLGKKAEETTLALDLSDWQVLASHAARNTPFLRMSYKIGDDSMKIAGIRIVPALGRLKRGA